MAINPEQRFSVSNAKAKGAPTPLALSFRPSLTGPEHMRTVARFSNLAQTLLRDLNRILQDQERRQSLPIRYLRVGLSINDPFMLRMSRRLGIRALGELREPILWTADVTARGHRQIEDAVQAWLVNSFRAAPSQAHETLDRLQELFNQGQMVEFSAGDGAVFAWEAGQTGTTRPSEIENPSGFSDLADFIARKLESKEVFAGLGPLRRIIGKDCSSGQAELMTPMTEDGSFSLVVTTKIMTFPGVGEPIVVFEFRRRLWMHEIRYAARRQISAFATPEGRSTAIEFSLVRERAARQDQISLEYQVSDDYDLIARNFPTVPQSTVGQEIIKNGHLIPDCPLLVSHNNSVGYPIGNKLGSVTDKDKIDAFQAVREILEPYGFHQWDGVTKTSTVTKPLKDQNRGWRMQGSQRHLDWQKLTRVAVDSWYGSAHNMIIGYHSSCYGDAQKAKSVLQSELGDRIHIEVLPIPSDVHGPRQDLPNHRQRANKRAEARQEAWMPFLSEVYRYQKTTGKSLHGILIIAPMWYSTERNLPDDTVNKRSARVRLAANLEIPIQYLLPEHENQKRGLDFRRRTIQAWQDLCLKTRGQYEFGCLREPLERSPAAVPDRILGIGVIRRNRTALWNERSFIPYAVELDLENKVSWARFARNSIDGNIETTARTPLPRALAELASSGPSSLTTSNGDKRRQRQEHAQGFFYEVITEFCQRAKSPLILIDAVTCRDTWGWLADAKIDPTNVLIGPHLHAEDAWENARLVRVRVDNSPKIIQELVREGIDLATGEVLFKDVEKPAEAQLFKLSSTEAHVYLSFGSIIRTNQAYEVSGYRQISRFKKKRGEKHHLNTLEEPFKGTWQTPRGVEIVVVKTPSGEHPDDVARIVEALRVFPSHWAILPAPLHLSDTLREYVADYSFAEGEEEVEPEE
ncbi:MAG: DUF3893 domain-containing protein [Dehalococcoidia bacterium]|nr:DUF3893 domain-containing protein [Dehalococcoidia bacterium]